MTHTITPSPVFFNYLAALRGVKPRPIGQAFAYADLTCANPEQLACLAASNPDGHFYGIVPDEQAQAAADRMAGERGVGNVTFLGMALPRLLGLLQTGNAPLPSLHYLSADTSAMPLNGETPHVLHEIANRILLPGGMAHLSYRTGADAHAKLKFLVREFGPEMTAEQAKAFLVELRQLGGNYLSRHADIAAKLDAAISKNMPDEFFCLWEDDKASSAGFETLVAMRERNFVYLGDVDMAANYMELTLAPEAQNVILRCTRHPLYEAIKEYALDRAIRSDIWCKPPASAAASLPELFNGFVFGITMAADAVPAEIATRGKTIDLAAPVYRKLISVLTLMPASIGDFLGHPEGKGFAPTEVIGALQVLIACGIARPMRGSQTATNLKSVAKPRLVGGFNKFLDKMPLTNAVTWLASPVLGDGMPVSPRDALVMQALDRGGLANSVAALLPELERLARNPAVGGGEILAASEATPELAHRMIEDVVSHSIVQWYAYGLLEAA